MSQSQLPRNQERPEVDRFSTQAARPSVSEAPLRFHRVYTPVGVSLLGLVLTATGLAAGGWQSVRKWFAADQAEVGGSPTASTAEADGQREDQSEARPVPGTATRPDPLAPGASTAGKGAGEPAGPVSSDSSPQPALASSVKLEVIRASLDGSTLDLEIAIRNQLRDRPIEGSIGGIATLTMADGRTIEVPGTAAPGSADLETSADGGVRLPYKARQVTRKTLRFEARPTTTGRFTDVHLVLTESRSPKPMIVPVALESSADRRGKNF